MKFEIFSVVTGTAMCTTICPFCVSGERPSKVNKIAPKINVRNFRKAAKLATNSRVNTVMLTSRGEPTLFPDQITQYLEELEPYEFPFIELQTNGCPMGQNFERYREHLQKWYDLGLTHILISTVSNRPEILKEVYMPHHKEYIDLPKLIENLHEIGFAVRLTCVATKAWMSTPEQLTEYLNFAKENNVEQVTIRPLNDEYRRETAQMWINEHKMSDEDKQVLVDFLNETGYPLQEIPHVGQVYDWKGQNVMLSVPLTKYTDHNSDEKKRNLIFFPHGEIRYEWEFEGGRLL